MAFAISLGHREGVSDLSVSQRADYRRVCGLPAETPGGAACSAGGMQFSTTDGETRHDDRAYQHAILPPLDLSVSQASVPASCGEHMAIRGLVDRLAPRRESRPGDPAL